jgi:hypothetical protein
MIRVKMGHHELIEKGSELFPKNTLTVIHDGEDADPYGLVMRLQHEPRSVAIFDDNIEEVLFRFISAYAKPSYPTKYLFMDHISIFADDNLSLLYRTSFDNLVERMKMAKLLNQPLVSVMEVL